MGCNLNQLSQCTSKCDCGNLSTLMIKDNGKLQIESDKQKKLKRFKKYNESKNFFQISREDNNSKNIVSINITENTDSNKLQNKSNEQKNLRICIHNKNNQALNNKNEEEELNTMKRENKISYINNCMNNVTIEGKEKDDENSSIYEDNKDSFLKMENNKNYENDKPLDKLQCSNIETKNDNSLEDIKHINIDKKYYEEDLIDMVNMIDKENGCENEIIFEGEKCIFNGKLDNKINISGKGKINLKDGRVYEGAP